MNVLVTYRQRLDIIADVLRVVRRNPGKTQILYQANLNYKILQRYLSDVLEASLVSFQEDDRHYILTDKGRQFLETYSDYTKKSKHVEKHLTAIKGKKAELNELCK